MRGFATHDARERRQAIVAALVLVAILVAVLIDAGDTRHDTQLVDRYCTYGAVSVAQREGCLEHVGARDVTRLHTNAARYARGEIDRCRADAGPLCR